MGLVPSVLGDAAGGGHRTREASQAPVRSAKIGVDPVQIYRVGIGSFPCLRSCDRTSVRRSRSVCLF